MPDTFKLSAFPLTSLHVSLTSLDSFSSSPCLHTSRFHLSTQLLSPPIPSAPHLAPILSSSVPPFHVSHTSFSPSSLSLSLSPLFILDFISAPACHNLSPSPSFFVFLYVLHRASLNRPCCLNGRTC